jgi:hypothetical protein
MRLSKLSFGLSASFFSLTTVLLPSNTVAQTEFRNACDWHRGILYEHPNLSGRTLGVDCNNRANDDSISNFGGGAQCAQRNAVGRCTWDWNDQASAVRNSGNGVVVLWAESNYSGRSVVLGPGDYDLNAYRFGDNANSVAYYEGTSTVPFQNKYYKNINDHAVYWYGRNFTCHVTGPAQMERFGGFDQVVLVSPNIRIPNANVNVACRG